MFFTYFRNFPTAENIAKKKAILAEKIARGEVIEEKYFGYSLLVIFVV